MLPSLTGAAAAALPPARLATGIAVQTTGRQIGSALGVALLVAVLGGAATGADGFRAAWELMFLGGLAAAIALTLTGPAAVARGGAAAARGGAAAPLVGANGSTVIGGERRPDSREGPLVDTA